MKNINIGVNADTGKPFLVNLDNFIEGKVVAIANSGGGKTHLIRKLVEEIQGQAQIIILDIEGEFNYMGRKLGFVVAGKDGDLPANPNHAEILCTKALEGSFDLVCDLYELKKHERLAFVRKFLEAMIDAPREFWGPPRVLILDEAHYFAPEGEKSESLNAVSEYGSRCRKRGMTLVLASQRSSKLNKDVMSECKNKIMGLGNMDIDRQRSAKELGFTTKEDILTLRDLEKGEFFAVGPAFDKGVSKIMVGQTTIPLPKKGAKIHMPAPTAKVKGILSKLKDLPQQAAEEAKTLSEMRIQISDMKRQLRAQPKDADKTEYTKVASRMVKESYVKGVADGDAQGQKAALDRVRKNLKELKAPQLVLLTSSLSTIQKAIGEAQKELPQLIQRLRDDMMGAVDSVKVPPLRVVTPMEKGVNTRPWDHPQLQVADVKQHAHMVSPVKERVFASPIQVREADLSFGKCERSILTLLNSERDRTFSRVQAGVMTGYSHASGSFSTAISNLRTSGYLGNFAGGGQLVIPDGMDVSKYATEHLFTLSGWMAKLGKCERQILTMLLADPERRYTREELAGDNYSPGSGSFSTALSNLASVGLLAREDGMILLNPEIKEWA